VKRHRFDPVSLAFGLLFVFTGGALLSGEVDLADLSGRGILVLPVLFGGVVLVAVGIRRLLGDRVEAPTGDAPDQGTDERADTEPLGG
jgi:hypothetical protein